MANGGQYRVIERFGDIKENYTYFIALIQSSVLPVRLPHTNSLGRTRQKLHQKVINDCLRVRLHHRLSDLSNQLTAKPIY